MGIKIVSPGFPKSTAIATPMPVMIQGGEVAILEGKAVPAIWAGPYGYSPSKERQVTSTDPGHNWVEGCPGILAADAGLETEADKQLFLDEFPTARPGLLYGIVFISWGNAYSYICDMYGADTASTKEYKDREDWAYNSGYFCRKRLFEPKTSSGGMWDITFAKPIPFYLGLRVSYDNGSSCVYFLYSLDPSFE